MKTKFNLFLSMFLANICCVFLYAQNSNLAGSIVDKHLVFEEKGGLLAVEAEHFYKQTNTDIRQWYRTSKNELPKVGRDDDGQHCSGASNNAYLEILPDDRVTHADPLISGENFSNEAGILSIIHYKVHFNTPGRYYVWARVFSTGGEDNGIHVGLNGKWPEHGQRMQWCEGKNEWTWGSQQRTEKVHCGVIHEIYLDIDKAGVHDIQFSMREDGFEFDKFILTKDINYVPKNEGLDVNVLKGKLPVPFPKVVDNASPVVLDKSLSYFDNVAKAVAGNITMPALQFPVAGTNYYVDQDRWLAINPDEHKEAKTSAVFTHVSGVYDLIFVGVGENDGQSNFKILINGKEVGSYSTPVSKNSFEEGIHYNELWEGITVNKGDKITIAAKVGSKDGEFSRGRWSGVIFAPLTKGKTVLKKSSPLSSKQNVGSSGGGHGQAKASKKSKNGSGDVIISGELKQWHKVTLTLDGPFATEADTSPNPFTDMRMTVTFTHESGSPKYEVPAYFAANGKAGESSSTEGVKWRAHISPDKKGKWHYKVSFLKGKMVAVTDVPWMKKMSPFDGVEGEFEVGETDKAGRDFRSKGRLEYVGKHHLQFIGTGEYFYKAGTDAPETLLGYEDFDNTIAMKGNVPLKKYITHIQDYNVGDPTWKAGKGKGLLGAVNYLAEKGINSISFLTYNAGGDGDNVWPFTSRNEKFHYDCSKLDQWQVVFDHAQSKGMYLHFKTQETENDDSISESLDGGDIGPERLLYYRELIARYGYLLALNWNLGEENTQSVEAHKGMADFFYKNDPYRHNVVIHSYPNQQDKVYTPLLGKGVELTGASLQNGWNSVFKQTLKWVSASAEAGKPWVVANDEQGSASKGVPPDPSYNGFDASKVGYSIDDVRKQTLWGNIMAGGAGVEYYFGYQLPENDLVCEDFRSRDRSWDFCKVAIDFLANNKIPFHEMKNRNDLVGNMNMNKNKYCLAKTGEIYLVYLAYAPNTTLDLKGESGDFTIEWFNPVTGGKLKKGRVKRVKGGQVVSLGNAPSKVDQDWVVIVRKK